MSSVQRRARLGAIRHMKLRTNKILRASFQVAALFFLALPALLRAEQVSQLKAWHRAGQTFLTWKEVMNPVTQDIVSVQELKKLQAHIEQGQRLRYRIYHSSHPIKSISGLKP